MPHHKLSADQYAELTEGIPEREYAHHDSVEEYIDQLIDEYDMHEDSIRPRLLSEPLVIYNEDSFRIAVSGNMDAEADNPLNRDAKAIHVLADIQLEYKAMYLALRICADIRTAYLRHRPGRCLKNTGESNFDTFKPSSAYVYIAFFDKEQHPPEDGV